MRSVLSDWFFSEREQSERTGTIYDSQDTLVSTVNTRQDGLGRETATWGTNTTPVFRMYDIRGRMVEMRTYLSGDLAIAPDAAISQQESGGNPVIASLRIGK